MDAFYTIMAYLPVVTGTLGTLAILVYAYQLIKKKSKRNIFLVIGCIGIGICLLIVCGLFLAGALGLGPTPT